MSDRTKSVEQLLLEIAQSGSTDASRVNAIKTLLSAKQARFADNLREASPDELWDLMKEVREDFRYFDREVENKLLTRARLDLERWKRRAKAAEKKLSQTEATVETS